MSLLGLGHAGIPQEALSEEKALCLDVEDANREFARELARCAHWFTWITALSFVNVLVVAMQLSLQIAIGGKAIGLYLPAALMARYFAPFEPASPPFLLGALLLVVSVGASVGCGKQKLWAVFTNCALYLLDTVFLFIVAAQAADAGMLAVIAVIHLGLLIFLCFSGYSAARERRKGRRAGAQLLKRGSASGWSA